MKLFIGIIFVVIIIAGLCDVINASNIEVVENCKVEKLVDQQIVTGYKDISTKYRYLIITDKETFICESSLINSKTNNSDIFWRLKEGQTYTFKVEGVGKSMIYDYRNILEIVK